MSLLKRLLLCLLSLTVATGLWLPCCAFCVSLYADVALAQPGDKLSSSASGVEGAVAAGRSVSVDAGIQILNRGGNAVDAAVATLLVQSVAESTKFCFGGEVPIMVYDVRRDAPDSIMKSSVNQQPPAEPMV